MSWTISGAAIETSITTPAMIKAQMSSRFADERPFDISSDAAFELMGSTFPGAFAD
jgi:hypothetical protein